MCVFERASIASLSTISSSGLTLFSECFSSFPHGTLFAIGLSAAYSALDGIYHPETLPVTEMTNTVWLIRAAFSNNPTLGKII